MRVGVNMALAASGHAARRVMSAMTAVARIHPAAMSASGSHWAALAEA
jgi:hypothetical protein